MFTGSPALARFPLKRPPMADAASFLWSSPINGPDGAMLAPSARTMTKPLKAA